VEHTTGAPESGALAEGDRGLIYGGMLHRCSNTSSGALDEGDEVGTWARVMVGAPCTKACLMLELVRGWELFGRLVHVGRTKEDIVRRYFHHLSPNSEHAAWAVA
jgi:hypothetical protein